MILDVHQPGSPLNLFVDNITYHERLNADYARDKLLPDGSINLIIDLTDTPKHVYDNSDPSQKQAFREGWIAGIRKEFIIFDAARDSAMLVIRFKPNGAFPFLGFPMCEISDQVIKLEDLWGQHFLLLREKLLEAGSSSQRIAVAETFLSEMLSSIPEQHPCIDYAVKFLSNGGASVPIKQLQKKVGFSHKHFIHLFEKHVGMTPKSFSRIMKFQKVVHALEQNKPLNWTQIALDCGYYDQAHFSNEFKLFSGLTPASYQEQKGEYINYIPLD